MKIRVYYEDTDSGGVVYHSTYLNFCERARSEVFFQKGMLPEGENSHFVVKHIEADYMKPAKLGDQIDVITNILDIKNASVLLRQEIFKENAKLFSMKVQVVYLKKGKPSRMTDELKRFFEEFDLTEA